MRKPGGYLVTTDPDPRRSTGQLGLVENDTITCGHCGALVKVPPMCAPQDMPYAICWGCQRNICAQCDHERARTLTCDVIEKKLERWEGESARKMLVEESEAEKRAKLDRALDLDRFRRELG
jgi:hypothetical protein